MSLFLVAVLGLEPQEFKELLVFLGGIVTTTGMVAVLAFQYLNNKLGRETRDKAEQAVIKATSAEEGAVSAKNEAANTKTELIEQLSRVEKNVDGKVSLLIEKVERVALAEGKEQGKAQAQMESVALRNEVRDAVALAVPPITPAASLPPAAPGTVADVHVVSTAAPVPVVITEEQAKSIPKPSEDDAPPG